MVKLIDIAGVAKLAGRNIEVVRQWPSQYAFFPDPVNKAACGQGKRVKRFWDQALIEAFLKKREQIMNGIVPHQIDKAMANSFLRGRL